MGVCGISGFIVVNEAKVIILGGGGSNFFKLQRTVLNNCYRNIITVYFPAVFMRFFSRCILFFFGFFRKNTTKITTKNIDPALILIKLNSEVGF